MKQDLIRNAVKKWAKQEATILAVEQYLTTWIDLAFALHVVRSIDYSLVDSFVSEIVNSNIAPAD